MTNWIKAFGSVVLAVVVVFLFIGVGAAISLVGSVIGLIAVAVVIVMFLAVGIQQWLRQSKARRR